MIEFQLDTGSGVATYLQLVQQVRQALRLGLLEPGDQLPTAQQVVAKLAINPNTVLKAYRELEREGLVRARPGHGHLRGRRRSRAPTPPLRPGSCRSMTEWLHSARAAGPRLRRHRGDLSHRRSQLLRGGGGMTAVLHAERARQAATGAGGRCATAPCRSPRAGSSGLVGPNGAGKTTLLHLAVGLLEPTTGTIRSSAAGPPSGPTQLGGSASSPRTRRPTPAVGRQAPAHGRLAQPELGCASWRGSRIERLGLDPRQRAGTLSGGQRAQLALTLAIAKRPELLILDEPVASLDPLARREFLQA